MKNQHQSKKTVVKQEKAVKQEHNVKVQAFRHMDYDEISDEETPTNLAKTVFEPRRIRREEEEPLSVRLKNYNKKLQMGRIPITLIDPQQIGLFGNTPVFKAKNFGPYIIVENVKGGVPAISPAQVQMYKQINLPFSVLHTIKVIDEDSQN